MHRSSSLKFAFALAAVLCLSAGLVHIYAGSSPAAPAPAVELTAGKVQLQSAGPLAFGPDGVLFVGDSVGAAIVAIDTNDKTPASSSPKFDVKDLNAKIGSLLGTSADQIMINDVKVNPISKNAYISVSRGRGSDGAGVIVKVDGSGQMTALALDNVKHSSASLVDAPKAGANAVFGGNA